MNEIATFFRQREQDSGETYEVHLRFLNLGYRFYIYARRPMDSKALQNRDLPDEKACDLAFQDLHSDLGTKGNGGWIVTVLESGAPRGIGVQAVPGVGHQPAGQFAVLAPGRAPYLLKSSSQGLEVPAGAHLILPVDEQAEAQLLSLLANLKWFPPDFESTFLNMLRRPSLDARLDRIEIKVLGRTATEEQQEANARFLPRTWRKAKRWILRPAALWAGIAAVLAALLVWNGLQLRGLESKMDAMGGRKSPPGAAAAANPSGLARTIPEKPSEALPGLSSDVRTLVSLLRQKASNTSLGLLYEHHFKEFADKTTDEAITRLFEKQVPRSQGPGARPFLFGIIKLYALKLDSEPQDEEFLKDWENITATKNVFSRLNQQGLLNDQQGLRMISALACRLGYNTPVSPGLPATENSTPFEFSPRMSCSEFTMSDIEKGLADLVTFVEER